MTQDHPITPSKKLIEQWAEEAAAMSTPLEVQSYYATQAARWGADQELEACCEWLREEGFYEIRIGHLRDFRRPKPLSLKEQAHQALGRFFSNAHTHASQMTQDFEIIRRAVEQLDD